MQTVYAILFYLNAICTGNYGQTEMDYIIAEHQQEISTIESDPVLVQKIEEEYGDEASVVVILPDGGGVTDY